MSGDRITVGTILRDAQKVVRRRPWAHAGLVLTQAVLFVVLSLGLAYVVFSLSDRGVRPIVLYGVGGVGVLVSTVVASFTRALWIALSVDDGFRAALDRVVSRAAPIAALGGAMGLAYGLLGPPLLVSTRALLVFEGAPPSTYAAGMSGSALLLWLLPRALLTGAMARIVLDDSALTAAVRDSVVASRGRRASMVASRWPAAFVTLLSLAFLAAAVQSDVPWAPVMVVVTNPLACALALAIDAWIDASWYLALHRKVDARQLASVFT